MTEHSTHVDVIRTAYRAFHERDLAGLLSIMAADVHWIHPDSMEKYGLGGTKVGHAGVRRFLDHVRTVLSGITLHPKEFVESGDRVVVFGVREVTSLSGHTETLSFVHSWTLRDGKAIRMEDIFDTAAFQAAIER
ncbi:nuclear transport factor 2 family protein [Streptomyces sp. NPDC001514]